MSDKRLYLIDATAFCYRAFYALHGLSTSFGQPTNAVYGFLNILNKILKEKRPDYLAICFDVSRDTFRAKKMASYKIQRPPMPEDLSSQIPIIKEIISAYRLAIFEKEGFEADDIIATLAKLARQKGLTVTIVSSDKDILQLVDKHTEVFSPYKDEGLTYDEEKVAQRFGVGPERIADIIALMGDSVDNIPGVPGIGEKTAAELIFQFGSLEALLKNLDKVKSEKIAQSIKDNLEMVKLNKELAVLDSNMKIDFDPEELKIKEPDYKELFKIFKYLEFKKLLKDLPQQEEVHYEVKVSAIGDDKLKSVIDKDKELFLYGTNAGDLVFFSGDKFFKLDTAGVNLKEVLADRRIKKSSHDLKKIKVALFKDGLILEGSYFDTMIAAYLANPSRPQYDLAELAYEYLKVPLAGHFDHAEGLKVIAQLKNKLEKELEEKSLLKLFSELEMPLVEVLAEMEQNGITLDLKLMEKLSVDIAKRLKHLIDEIYTLSETEFNINSPKQLREVLFTKLKLPVVKKTKTGPSTDEEVLRALADKHTLPALLLEYRQLSKLKTTYIDTLPEQVDKKTGRIHTSFNQAATETGRLSSSNPNLQNIPVKTEIGKKIRQAIIVSDSRNYLLSCDYSQIELRILAHLSGDENLIAAFKKGMDIHRLTASLIYGIKEEDVTEKMRETAKRVNFGIVYGLTSYGLSRDLGIPVDQAQQFIDAYFLRYPQVQVYIQQQITKAKKDGFVATLLGRRRYIPEINNKNIGIRQFAERQAVNTPIQGLASDMIKLAMVDIHRHLKEEELKTRMILQIHDELVFDVESEELKEVTELVRDRMENVLKLDVPVEVDIKKGKNWLEMEEI